MFNLITLFVIFANFSAQLFANSDSRKYFEQDRDAYVHGAAACLQSLPHSCRYRQSKQENHTLPDCFVTGEVRVGLSVLIDKVFFKSGTTNFAAALDSLEHPPTSTSKWIIDCSIATAFAELQGIRRIMVGNDELFNQWCRNNLSKDKHGFATNVHNNFYMSPARLMQEMLTIGSQFLPGLTVYFEQLKNVDNFNIPGNNQAISMLIQGLLAQYDTVYLVKHPYGNMRGINTICDDKEQMVFFANYGSPNKLNAQEIADMLVSEMDANSTNIAGGDDKIAEFRKVCGERLLEICPELDFLNLSKNFATVFGSICYKDKKSAAREILKLGQSYCLDFAAVRKSISVTAIMAFLNKFKSDEKFKTEFLAGLAK